MLGVRLSEKSSNIMYSPTKMTYKSHRRQVKNNIMVFNQGEISKQWQNQDTYFFNGTHPHRVCMDTTK